MEVPDKSTILEFGPSGLLSGLMQRAKPSCTVIPLQKSRGESNGLEEFLSALGKVYMSGINFVPLKLYEDVNDGPVVHFPVPLGTPMISPLIQWDHDVCWDVPIHGKVRAHC